MRKTIALIFTLLFVLGVFSFVACNDTTPPAPDNDNTTVVEKKSLIQQHNEVYETDGKAKWYDYEGKEYSFGELYFATQFTDPGCISYSWEDLSHGYDLTLNYEASAKIREDVENNVSAKYGLSDSENSKKINLAFIDISENSIEEDAYNDWIRLSDIAKEYYQGELETYEDVARYGVISVNQYENERITMETDMILYVDKYETYYGALLLSIHMDNERSLIHYKYSNHPNTIDIFYVISDKVTKQKFVFVISMDLLSDYSTAVMESTAYQEDKDTAIMNESQKLYSILNPYINEIVDDYLIEEYGVEL